MDKNWVMPKRDPVEVLGHKTFNKMLSWVVDEKLDKETMCSAIRVFEALTYIGPGMMDVELFEPGVVEIFWHSEEGVTGSVLVQQVFTGNVESDATQKVSCPKCGARKNKECKTSGRRSRAHAARIKKFYAEFPQACEKSVERLGS